MSSITSTAKNVVIQNEEDNFFDDVCGELRCVVCRSVLIDPRVLHCHHTFCLRCLFSQVQYDRGERLRIPCPFRCPGETVTVGDIRTVPRIPLLSNVVLVARRKLMEAEERVGVAATLAASSAASHAIRTSEEDGGAVNAAAATSTVAGPLPPAEKVMECEWCSLDTASCRVCQDCMSRLCNKCSGPFSSHHFLCTEMHQQGGGRSAAAEKSAGGVSELARAFQEVETGLAATRGASAAAAGAPHPMRSLAAIQQPQDVAVGVRHFPFLILPREVQQLVQKHVTTLNLSPLSVHIVDLQKVRLATKLTRVQCSQSASGFSTSYEVIPTLEVGPYELDIQSTRWGYGHRGSDVLLFLTNVLRVTHKTLENLLSVCREVNVVLGELRSQARKALVEDNQGFRAYGVHVLQVARQYLTLAKIILSYLVRVRFLEGIMGDCIVNRYHQVWAQLAPSEKHNLRTRCLSFLHTEMELGVELDVAMKRIDAKCGDLREYAKQLAKELEDQQRQYVQRRQLARQPRPTAAPPCPSAKGVPEESVRSRWFSARGPTGPRRTKIPVKKEGVSDPVSALYADHTFLGQFQEREHSVRGLTQSTLVALETCLQLRHWVWYFSNTALRECGAGEEREEKLLDQEKFVQMMCDRMLQLVYENTCFCYTYQGAVSAQEAVPTFQLTDGALNLGLRRDALENDIDFDFESVNGENMGFQTLRRSMVALESDEQFFENVRSFDNQAQLRDVMCSVLETYHDVQVGFFSQWFTLEKKQLAVLWEQLHEHFGVPRPDVDHLLPRSGNPFAVVKRSLAETDDEVYSTCAPERLVHHGPLEGKGCQLHVTDFIRRGAAFACCTFFGAQLIDVANGVLPAGLRNGCDKARRSGASDAPHSLQKFDHNHKDKTQAEPDEREVEFLQSMAAPCLFPSAPVPESNTAATAPADTEDNPLELMETSLTGRRSRKTSAAASLSERPRLVEELETSTEDFHGLPMSFRCFMQKPKEEENEEDVGAAAAAAPAVETSKGGGKKKKGIYNLNDLTFCHERVFAVDGEESDVAILCAEPIEADASGFVKAAVQFKKQFRFTPNRTTTESEVSVTVPFYVGTYSYKNGKRFHYFFVDAQSGKVWLTPPSEDHVLFMSKVTRVVGSPLFFLTFNLILSRFASKNTKSLTI